MSISIRMTCVLRSTFGAMSLICLVHAERKRSYVARYCDLNIFQCDKKGKCCTMNGCCPLPPSLSLFQSLSFFPSVCAMHEKKNSNGIIKAMQSLSTSSLNRCCGTEEDGGEHTRQYDKFCKSKNDKNVSFECWHNINVGHRMCAQNASSYGNFIK